MQQTMRNLSIIINASANFEPEPDSLTTSMSSSFASSGCVTPTSSASYMSRRPSRGSDCSFPQYMSGQSSINSASPTTPVAMNSFSMDPSSFEPGRFVPGSFFEDIALAHGIGDSDVPMLSLAESAPKPPQGYWEALSYTGQYVMDANEMYNPGMSNLLQGYSAQTMVSQPAEESLWSSGPMYETCSQPINQSSCRWGSMNSQQHAQTIVPSQTLVEQPTTPLIKPEPFDLQQEVSELPNPMEDLDMSTYRPTLIPSSLPTLPPAPKARAKRSPFTPTSRTAKGSPGIVKLSSFKFFTNRSGRALPYSNIAERRRVVDNREAPNGHMCDQKKANGEMCDKSFKRKEHLTRHKKTHTGEKTRKCPFCARRIQAAREDNMKTHIEKTHIKESPSGRNERYWLNPVTKEKFRITHELMRAMNLEVCSKWKGKK